MSYFANATIKRAPISRALVDRIEELEGAAVVVVVVVVSVATI